MTGVPIPRPIKKPPCGGFFIGAGLKTRAVRLLLGSSVSSSLGSVSGSLGSVASGVGSVSSSTGDGTSSRTHGSAGSGSSVGHSSSGGSGSFCRSGSSHGSGCGCRSGFFLLATSGQSSGSNQSGEYERLIHFSFLVGRTKHLGMPQRPIAQCCGRAAPGRFLTQTMIILSIRQYPQTLGAGIL